jgi:hypothetical protein
MTKDEALDKALEAAYLAGFNASGEGYNGEYPFRDHGAHPEQDAGWIKNRDSELNAIKQARSAPVQPVEVDAEGENMAVRSFLMLYGQPGLTVGKMKKHMDMSGHSCCPAWVYTEPDGAHLTKAGAQLWIRHLFALESTPPAAQRQWVGLTQQERKDIWREAIGWGDPSHDDIGLMIAIEAKLKEKNT